MAAKIFFGAPVYTMDDEQRVAEAVVVADGKVEYIASDSDDAIALYPDSELVQLHGGCLLPGFVDAHLHLLNFALLFRDLDLTACVDREEVIEGLNGAAKGRKGGKWLTAGGLSGSLLETMSRQDLDRASPEVPVLLYSRDMHSAIVNSVALLKAGIDESRADPLGGLIGRDVYGVPNGVLKERAVDLVARIIPVERTRRVDAALESGIAKLLSYGITSFCDCSVESRQGTFRSLVRLSRRGRLAARALIMLGESDAVKLGEVGVPSMYGDDLLKLGGIKLIIDGSLSARTGYMTRPYSDGGYGMLLVGEEELFESLKKHYANLIWAAVHCIGDKANEVALNVFQRLGEERGIPHLLKRIEHAQSLKDEDIERFASLGVVAVVNPGHIPFDREKAIKFLGSDARLLHRFRSLIASGATVAFSSDAPVASVDPFRILYCAVERKDFEDGPELRFYPKERISLADAMRAYTLGGAAACGLENDVGSIEPGKRADLIHVSHDVFRNDIGVLAKARVLETYVNGQLVYRSPETEK